MKKAGKGIFAPKTLSAELAAVCGKKVMPRTEVRAGVAWPLGYVASIRKSYARTFGCSVVYSCVWMSNAVAPR